MNLKKCKLLTENGVNDDQVCETPKKRINEK